MSWKIFIRGCFASIISIQTNNFHWNVGCNLWSFELLPSSNKGSHCSRGERGMQQISILNWRWFELNGYQEYYHKVIHVMCAMDNSLATKTSWSTTINGYQNNLSTHSFEQEVSKLAFGRNSIEFQKCLWFQLVSINFTMLHPPFKLMWLGLWHQ